MRLQDLICQATAFIKDGVFIAVSDGRSMHGATIVWCNDQLPKFLKQNASHIVGALLGDVVDLNWPRSHLSDEGQTATVTLQPSSHNTLDHDLELAVHTLCQGLEGRRSWVGVVTDTSEYVRAQTRFQEIFQDAETARKRLWDAVEAMPDAFLMLDRDDRLIAFNEKFRQFYSHSAPAIFEGAEFGSILRYGLENGQYPEALGNEEDWLAERLDRSNRLSGPIDRMLPGDRHLIIHDVETENGDIVGLRTDVTEFKRQQRDLEENRRALQRAKAEAESASRTDSLTGLANRRGLDMHLDNLASSKDTASETALIHIDLDRFKAINDVFGHAAGDHVLGKVSEIMQQSVRPSDFAARVGGDEFVVVATVHNQAQSLAERIASSIIEKCEEPIHFHGKELRFGASIGIAIAPVTDLIGLMENADIALYEAKTGGRNQYALFTPRLRTLAEQKRRIADDLLKGIADGQIVAYFQPQVSSQDYELVGVEALARWIHPTKGLVAPGEFLSVAEELGLLGEIDNLILNQALSCVQKFTNSGILIPKISVNVSYKRLKTNGLSDCLDRLRPWPCRLAFELLETIDYDQEADEFAWILDELREKGVEIELDDFGSGRASITTLLRLQPDRIKIDRQLVASISDETSGANPLVRAIAEMGKAIGIMMTAEGVETEVQAEVLRSLGCDVLQGYLFAPAMSEDHLRDWIKLSHWPRPFQDIAS